MIHGFFRVVGFGLILDVCRYGERAGIYRRGEYW